MSDNSQQRQKRHERLSFIQIVYIAITIASLVTVLKYIFTTLNFFYGVDYRMFCIWQETYTATGIFYHEKTSFYNFPLTVVAFGPYAFLPVSAAVTGKIIQTVTLGCLSVILLFRISGDKILADRNVQFIFALLAVTFFLMQLCYLNIYVEVLTCLLLSLYFYKLQKYWLSALFLSLAIIFKVFLAPLVCVALLSKEYRLFYKTCICFFVLVLVSILLFGFQVHVDMLHAMAESYSKMRAYGSSLPYVSDGFSGYQDLLNKLVMSGALTEKMVMPFTLIFALFYGCVVLYVLYAIFIIISVNGRTEDTFFGVFATVLVFSIAFNFRFDHGLLLLAIVPFLAGRAGKKIRLVIVAVVLIVLIRYTVEKVLTLVGMTSVSGYLSKTSYFLTFHFIGINLLVYFFASYWLDLYRKVTDG